MRLDAEVIRDSALFAARAAERANRRAERLSLSSAGAVAGDQQSAGLLADLQTGFRREALSPQPVHVLETHRSAAFDGCL